MSKQSMGDLFLQQRQPKSFAEIQREQLNEHKATQILSRPAPSKTNPPNRTARRSSQDQPGPKEQGVIHTLLDKFGFIHCADRPAELFFHYTSTNIPWDDLNIGDQVEFRVGVSEGRRTGEEDKLKALEVRLLPPDSIVWEKEDVVDKRYKGSVKAIPNQKNRGILRAEETDAYFTTSDCKSRLGKGDVVEFSVFTERRTGDKLARNIIVLQSEKERQRQEKEAKLLENAMLEQGVVVSDKGDFGFIKSTHRTEEVYFHISHVDIHDESTTLKEGQDVEFYVVDESSLGDGRKKSGRSLAARKIKMLPMGTVKFERVLAEGATGVVVECPIEQGTEGFGRSGNVGKKGNAMGKIRLDVPVRMEGGDVDVWEVILHPDLYPGGTYALNRVGSEMGCWLRPGDVLLFDVIQTISDGKCKAVPTKYTLIKSLRPEGWTPDNSTKPAVRLVKLALMGRTEGVVRLIRDDYAFIQCAERNVDAYVKLYEVFPNELYSDLVLNSPEVYTEETNLAQKGGRIKLEVGMAVSFDLSLQMISNHSGPGGRGGGRNMRTPPQEKESLRARRVQILPSEAVKDKISIAAGAKATVVKADKRHQFAGSLELEESVTVQLYSQRYPYIAKLLDSISAGKYGDEVVFNDVLSEKDAQAVTTMVNTRDDLVWKYVALEGESVSDSHNRKICISKHVKESASSSECEIIPTNGTSENEETEERIEGAESSQIETTDLQTEEAPTKEILSESSGKKKSKGERVIKKLSYDRSSFSDLSIGSLGVGDVITCDLYLSRSSGQVHVENIAIVERKEQPMTDAEKNGKVKSGDKKNLTGYVTEVVASRQFGFITGIDENGSKTGDHVFFHFKTVDAPDDTPQDASPTKVKKIKSDVIRKGDEVKFDAEPGKNGKLTATKISILPRGTLKLPSKVDKSTVCTGYILLEPSHTSLANTPSHMVVHTGPSLDGAGRWDNVGKEPKATNASGSNIKEEGVILLLTDPSHLFSPKPQSERKSSIDETDTNVEDGMSDEKAKPELNDTAVVESAVGTHVRYKASSLAYRFSTDNPDRPDGPRRGDLVVFGKTKGANVVKDIRIEKLEAATTVKGVLVDIKADENTATFVSSEDETKYSISLTEVVSCEKSLLKENQEVNGVLHDGKIFGVCRTKDIFLTSSFAKNSSDGNNGPRQRPKLNLTVKKELQGMGGQIMAQSKMAKGPDGTNGFAPGWTKRLSPNVKTFVPANIPDTGFISLTHTDESTE